MAKCSVCGSKIVPGVDKCPLCGTKVAVGSSNTNANPLEGAGEILFTIGKVNMDLFDVIAAVVLIVYTLVNIINILGNLFNGYGFLYGLLSTLQTVLSCVSLWGLFVYYKSNEKVFKFVTGIAIIGSLFFMLVYNLILFFGVGYVSFWGIISSFVNNLAPMAVPFIIIVLKNKDEKDNIKL